MEKDVFKFDDFLSGGSSLEYMKMRLIKEGILTEEEIKEAEEKEAEKKEEEKGEPEKEQVEKEEELAEEKSGDSGHYKLYRDKAEDFVCDISIEGARASDTEARLLIESDEWCLMFRGEIANGKCVIPIKKLSILPEGLTGKIRLEVSVEGNLFVPWEDKFIVRSSKKVTVKVAECSNYMPAKATQKSPGVKVNFRR